MPYVVGVRKYKDMGTWYMVFESKTESCYSIERENLTNLVVNKGLHIENIASSDGEIVIKQWFNEIQSKPLGDTSGVGFMLLSKVSENKYKLVDHHGEINYADKDIIHNYYCKEKKIVNCEIRDGKLISIGTYTILENKQLEKEIARKYELFEAKTRLLGYNMSFDYEIEDDEVKLIEYTGTSKEVIIPKFITIIMKKAFLNCNIETLTLDRGLTHIGSHTFEGCNISEVIIPDTVEIICAQAFHGNKRLVGADGLYTNNIKILNKKTIVMN